MRQKSIEDPAPRDTILLLPVQSVLETGTLARLVRTETSKHVRVVRSQSEYLFEYFASFVTV
jgi:hypothetical protein